MESNGKPVETPVEESAASQTPQPEAARDSQPDTASPASETGAPASKPTRTRRPAAPRAPRKAAAPQADPTGEPETSAPPARRSRRRSPSARTVTAESPEALASLAASLPDEAPSEETGAVVAAISTEELPAGDAISDETPLALEAALEEAPLSRLPVAPLERLLLETAEAEPDTSVSALAHIAAPSSNGDSVQAVLVPEALEETPRSALEELEAEFLTPPASRTAAGVGLPPITPELLAEVRAGMVEEPPARTGPQRGRPEPRPERPERPPRVREERPRLPEPPGLVVVPEALLEAVPEDWAEETWADEQPVEPGTPLREAFPGLPDVGGRRRRRRGRDRRPGDEATLDETPRPAPVVLQPVAPPASLAPTPPPASTVTLLRADDEPASRASAPEKRDREFKEILVNVDERETRIAVLEDGRLVELHVEREERVVGGIYKGRVANVLQGMDAAFVDIGLERNAFLYVGDILFDAPGGRHAEADAPARRTTSRDVRIKDLAKPGQEMLVQVVKGPRGTKGSRISTKISIPGRYLVLMPDGDHLGVSRKVDDVRERDRLKRIAEQMQPKGFGLIVRTEAEGRTELELRQDLDYLVNSWQKIVDKNKKVRAPALLHQDVGIILKTIRDLFGQDVDKLILDSPEDYEKAIETLAQLAPDLVDRVHLHADPEPLFVKYNVEEEIDRLLRRKVWIRNGAYLLIDTTEALTTIDVNTGKFVGTSSLSETILKTNLDAVDEISRQLRLRDIGGMIVLDFIDMASARDRQLVMRNLENAFRKDRMRTKIAHISPLGLVEMTRKRTAEGVTDMMTETCSYCQGRGRVWSAETMAIQIEREIRRRCAKEEMEAVLVYVHPEVAVWLVGPEGESVERLERSLRRPVYVRARQDQHVEKFEILPGDMLELEQGMMPFHGGQVVECSVTKMELITPPRSAAWVDGYFVDLANGVRFQGQTARVRLTDVRRSFALGELVPGSAAVDRGGPV